MKFVESTTELHTYLMGLQLEGKIEENLPVSV